MTYSIMDSEPRQLPHSTSLDGEPAFPTTPVLSLELANISKMSKGGREGLSYMWTVFSRCKESIRDGRRLENLSWRLWYEDLKTTGCVTCPPLSDPESETTDSSDEDDKLFDSAGEVESAAGCTGKEKNTCALSDTKSAAQGSSDLPLIDGSGETHQPNLSQGSTKQATKPAGVEGGEGRLGRDKHEGPALHGDTLASIPFAASVPAPSRISDSPAEAACASPSGLRTTQPVLPAPPSIQQQLSLSKQLRRSSCPASRNPETLRISRMSSNRIEQGQMPDTAAYDCKKEKRAMSFANAPRPSHHHQHTQKLARAVPPLTPETIQDIIGTVLPMNFMSYPRIQLSAPTPSASITTHTVPANLSKPASTPPTSTTCQSDNEKSTSPTRRAKMNHTREPSIKSEQSYFTSTTAFSDAAIDPVFSPERNRVRFPLSSHEPQDGIEVPTSAPLEPVIDANGSIPSPRLTQSEEIRITETPSPLLSSNGEEGVQSDSPSMAGSIQRNPSHQKIAVKPALLKRPKTSSSSSGINKSALQRTQSAKSVRIIESPTEADGAALEGRSGDAVPSTTSGPSYHRKSHDTAHHTHSKASQAHLKSSNKHSHIPLKRTTSSTRMKGHTRNASSTNLHREGRLKSPPPISENAAPSEPATTSNATTPLAPAPDCAQERKDLMQAAPHVTKAINIRRNSSSLANLIQTEPRSVSRGFAVTPSSMANGVETDTHEQRHQQQNGVSSPSSTAVAADAVQSVPDPIPPLHPPPPSPASPVVPVPSSVVLPPQPRSSPADPRFRIHSTIRRPPSPPLEEEQDDPDNVRLDRPLSPSESDHDLASMRRTREANGSNGASKTTLQIAGTMPASDEHRTAPRDMIPEPQQLTNAKKKQMFFLNSPTTDSDDEGQPGSLKFRPAAPLPIASIEAGRTGTNARLVEEEAVKSDSAAVEEKDRRPGKPAIKVVQVTSPTEGVAERKKNSEGAEQQRSEDEDDDGYEDEDDSDDWSSEATESEEDEHQAAIRREEERQRLMFAKRTPSMVATQGGLLSKLLRPEEYNHGSANMPAHLRNNASAMHLNQLPNVGSTAGIERAKASNALFTVTGLLASKSTAALPDLKAAQPSSRLVPTKSGNRLTRLGGAPSGVELESDDDDDDQAMPEISPTQQQKLNVLLQRTTSSQGKAHNASPPRQQEIPLTQVSRVNSAAQIAMQPESPNVFTPRTTRRNMLSTELTESLRASLLAERNRNRPSIERIVSAFGNRFTGGNRQQQQQQQQVQTVQQPQVQAERPEFTPSKKQASHHPSASSAPSEPPCVQRGSTGFTPLQQDASPDDRLRPDAAAASGRKSHSRPPPTSRADSDPPQQAEYYSPGFHHTGW